MSQTALTSTQKTEDRPISLNHNLKLETVGVLSDTASALLGGLRYVSGSFDTFTNALSFYISPPWRRVPSEAEPGDKNKRAKPRLTRELQILWNIKEQAHKKGITDEYNPAKGQFNKRVKNTKSQHRTWEESHQCHQWLWLKIVFQIYHSPTLANDI